jgi:hypothetical protein
VDLRAVYERTVRAVVVGEKESVGSRLDKGVLFRGDAFGPRIESDTAIFAASDC